MQASVYLNLIHNFAEYTGLSAILKFSLFIPNPPAVVRRTGMIPGWHIDFTLDVFDTL